MLHRTPSSGDPLTSSSSASSSISSSLSSSSNNSPHTSLLHHPSLASSTTSSSLNPAHLPPSALALNAALSSLVTSSSSFGGVLPPSPFPNETPAASSSPTREKRKSSSRSVDLGRMSSKKEKKIEIEQRASLEGLKLEDPAGKDEEMLEAVGGGEGGEEYEEDEDEEEVNAEEPGGGRGFEALGFTELMDLLMELNYEGDAAEEEDLRAELVKIRQTGKKAAERNSQAIQYSKDHLQARKTLITRLDDLSATAGRLCPRHQEKIASTLDRIAPLRKELESTRLVVMFAGDSSSGKSSLINAILGLELLPTSPKPCTSTICEIHYGKTPLAEVYFKNGSPKVTRQLTKETAAEILKPYLCLEGDERYNVNPCAKVVVHWPLNLLKYGLVLVDSPGLGESDLMSKIAQNFLHKATCLACVVNSSRGTVTLQFRDFLGQAASSSIGSEYSLLICNKWGQIRKEEQDLVKDNIFASVKRVWPDVDRSQLVSFDVLLASRFKTFFPGYISPEEATLCEALATFLNSIHRLMEADFKQKIKGVCEEVHFFLINAIEGASKRVEHRLELELKYNKANTLRTSTDEIIHQFFSRRSDSQRHLLQHLREQKERLVDWGQRLLIFHKFADQEEPARRFKEKINDIMQEWEEEHREFKTLRLEAQAVFSKLIKEAFRRSYNPNQYGNTDSSTLAEQARAWYKSGRNFVIKVVHLGFKEYLPESFASEANWRALINAFLENEAQETVTKFASDNFPLEQMITDFKDAFADKLQALQNNVRAEFSAEEEVVVEEVYRTTLLPHMSLLYTHASSY